MLSPPLPVKVGILIMIQNHKHQYLWQWLFRLDIDALLNTNLLVMIGDDAGNNTTSESHVPRTIANGTCTMKRNNLAEAREYRCGTGQTPSEGQVRIILTALEC